MAWHWQTLHSVLPLHPTCSPPARQRTLAVRPSSPCRVIEFKTGPQRPSSLLPLAPSPFRGFPLPLSLDTTSERERASKRGRRTERARKRRLGGLARRHGGDDGEEMKSDLFILTTLHACIHKSRRKRFILDRAEPTQRYFLHVLQWTGRKGTLSASKVWPVVVRPAMPAAKTRKGTKAVSIDDQTDITRGQWPCSTSMRQ